MNTLAILLCLVAICSSSGMLAETGKPQARDGFGKYITVAGTQYYYDILDNYSWAAAIAKCGSVGMHLVTFETAAEYLELNHYFQYNESEPAVMSWTSGNDLDVEGSYVWGSSGKSFDTYVDDFWASNCPRNDTRTYTGYDCVMMYVDKNELMFMSFCDYFCNGHLAIICEEYA